MRDRYVLDTNILLLLVKNPAFGQYFDRPYGDQLQKELLYSYISLGELDSITKQNQWGDKRLKALQEALKGFTSIPVTGRRLIAQYGDIDAYSQGKLSGRPFLKVMSARNMGKNDLWIAAITAALGATLITTDLDFGHLFPDFFAIDWID
ncbi:MAG: PIN domain-containing protein, partial [Bacteroidota bacterium]